MRCNGCASPHLIAARQNHCFQASVQVLPSLNQKHPKHSNILPKLVYHGSPKQSFGLFLPSEVCEPVFMKMWLCDWMKYPTCIWALIIDVHGLNQYNIWHNASGLLTDICDLIWFYENLWLFEGRVVLVIFCGIKMLLLILTDSLKKKGF